MEECAQTNLVESSSGGSVHGAGICLQASLKALNPARGGCTHTAFGTLLQCEVEFGFAGDINRTAEMWSQSTAALHLVADSGMLCAEPPAAIWGECPCAWHECPEQHAGTG